MHRHTHQGLIAVDENLTSVQLVAQVRREIFAARTRELPWEYRVEWARRGDTPYPAYSTGRAVTESNALRTARMLLHNATETADPRAVAAWIKGPGDDDYRPVYP
ncbi:MAG TPA: hypothetical protein VL551_19350 [Actinospica sp.]|jgi:hypothetical protein|nr:hypothetical protein [Actinospica sp.]